MSNKVILNKTTLITGPQDYLGKSWLANNLAYMFAQKGYLTGLIELNRYAGTSPYFHFVDMEEDLKDSFDKNLKEAVNSLDEIKASNCFIQSKKCENLFTLSLLIKNKLDDLFKFPIPNIEKLIKIARSRFDVIFIDAPSNYIENGFMAGINSHPDQTILLIDDNYVTLHKLKLMDEFFDSTKFSLSKICLVQNKSFGLLPKEDVKKVLDTLKVVKVDKHFVIPNMPDVVKGLNDGVLQSDIKPSNRHEKAMISAFNGLFDYIYNHAKVDDNNGK